MSTLTPGIISPRREVPASIPRPEYVGKPAPTPYDGSYVTAPEVVDKMRVASKLAAQALQAVGAAAKPGVTTDELDRVGHEYLIERGAYPSTLGYRGYPKSLCTSVNEVICHGIPDDRQLEDGDIVNVDITAFLDGVHGDTNATFLVGDVDEESRLLVERTQEALNRGIKAVKARSQGQHHRPRDRVLRQAFRVRRGSRLHRPRHRDGVPLRPDHPALRRRSASTT
jgi:methionyl aminopeptidase